MKKPVLPLVQPGTISRECSPTETDALVTLWLETYGKDKDGVNAKAYMWHVFSANRYPSLTGSDAMAEYKAQVAAEYVVLSNDRKTAFTTDLLPIASFLSDWYVFPKNLAWTMAFTHEDGWLGPYFARHPQYPQLNEENLARVRKHAEAAAARQKGWR